MILFLVCICWDTPSYNTAVLLLGVSQHKQIQQVMILQCYNLVYPNICITETNLGNVLLNWLVDDFLSIYYQSGESLFCRFSIINTYFKEKCEVSLSPQIWKQALKVITFHD